MKQKNHNENYTAAVEQYTNATSIISIFFYFS